MNILVLNDIHIADKPPMGRVDGYTEHIFAKLEECRDLAATHDVTLFTGDLFHIKRPQYVSHRLVQRLIDLLLSWPGERLALVGNHDLSEAGIASVERQPIGVLFRAGALTWLENDRLVADGRGVVTQFSPVNYRDDLEHNTELYALEHRSPQADFVVKVAHGMLTPPKKSFPFEHTPIDSIDITGIDVYAWGHPHYDFGIKSINGCWFASLGSLSRVARTEFNLTRGIDVLSIALDKNSKGQCLVPNLKRIPLKSVLPSSEVFIDIEAALVDAEVAEPIKHYAAQLLGAIQRSEDDIPIDSLLPKDLPEGVRKRVREYLTAAGL